MRLKTGGRLLVGIGVAGVAVASALAIMRVRQVRAWDSYPAQVVAAEVASRPATKRRPPADGYGVRAEVTFLRGGKPERRLIEPSVFTTSFQDVAHEADDLRRPAAHRLFINPLNAQDAVLDPRPSLRLLIVPAVVGIFGGGALVFGLLMLALASSWSGLSWRWYPRIAFVASAVLVAFAGALVAKRVRQRAWPQVDAEISSVDQVYREEDASDGDTKMYEDFYAVRTWVSLDVNGTRYPSVIVGPYERNADLRHAVAARNQVGHLRVRYNPSDPYEVIEKPVGFAFVAIPVGLAVLFASLGILVSAILKRREASSAAVGAAA